MTATEFEIIIAQGESSTVEFKSWKKASGMKEKISLAVDELIAFANTKGGTLYFGVEDNGTVTGCDKYDIQKLLESIYDKTRPPLFAEAEEIQYGQETVIALSVKADGVMYSTTDGRMLKRLGSSSKASYPAELGARYSSEQNQDFSAKILADSTLNDVNLLEIYNLKEKLKVRDPESTLIVEEDMAFLRDLGLLKDDSGTERLTVAGLLFVGKESSINRLLPQAEVIYLHYGEKNLEEYDSRIDMRMPIVTILDKMTDIIQRNNRILNVQIGLFRLEVMDYSIRVFQEALLNALSHRDYESLGAVYIKQYPDKVVIENPGGFLEGINEKNIITHPSKPRNKLIAETLQRLKYVQRTGQGVDIIFREMISMGKPYPQYQAFSDAVLLTLKSAVENSAFVRFVVNEQEKQQRIFSLPALMILRYLSDSKRIKLSEIQELTQTSLDDSRKTCAELVKSGLIESVGKEYMLTARVYEALKSDVEYTRDRVVRYIKAKAMIMDYLKENREITNSTVQELCGFTKQQARSTLDKMRAEQIIEMVGKGKGAKYIMTQ